MTEMVKRIKPEVAQTEQSVIEGQWFVAHVGTEVRLCYESHSRVTSVLPRPSCYPSAEFHSMKRVVAVLSDAAAARFIADGATLGAEELARQYPVPEEKIQITISPRLARAIGVVGFNMVTGYGVRREWDELGYALQQAGFDLDDTADVEFPKQNIFFEEGFK